MIRIKFINTLSALTILLLLFLFPTKYSYAQGLNCFNVDYYENSYLSGNPKHSETHCNNEFQRSWGNKAPSFKIPVGGVGKEDDFYNYKTVRVGSGDNFSVRLLGYFEFEEGKYLFKFGADDGIRLWIDKKLVIDLWQVQSYIDRDFDYYMHEGIHEIMVNYFEHGGVASLYVGWEPY